MSCLLDRTLRAVMIPALFLSNFALVACDYAVSENATPLDESFDSPETAPERVDDTFTEPKTPQELPSKPSVPSGSLFADLPLKDKDPLVPPHRPFLGPTTLTAGPFTPPQPEPEPDPQPRPDPDDAVPASPFVYRVEYVKGVNGGFNEHYLPEIIQGPPRGAGFGSGSSHVFSVGQGGVLILEFHPPIQDGPGADFIIFENTFYVGFDAKAPTVELGEVAVSEDKRDWFVFPCARTYPYQHCAGVTPVLANADLPDLDYDPFDPTPIVHGDGSLNYEGSGGGGDAFDLSFFKNMNFKGIRFIRIQDLNAPTDGTFALPPWAGFDLDAVTVLHQ